MSALFSEFSSGFLSLYEAQCDLPPCTISSLVSLSLASLLLLTHSRQDFTSQPLHKLASGSPQIICLLGTLTLFSTLFGSQIGTDNTQ